MRYQSLTLQKNCVYELKKQNKKFIFILASLAPYAKDNCETSLMCSFDGIDCFTVAKFKKNVYESSIINLENDGKRCFKLFIKGENDIDILYFKLDRA